MVEEMAERGSYSSTKPSVRDLKIAYKVIKGFNRPLGPNPQMKILADLHVKS